MFIKTYKVKRAFRGIQSLWYTCGNLAKRPSHKRKSKFNIGTKELNTWNYNFLIVSRAIVLFQGSVF